MPASVVAIGAGNRMRTYMHYAAEHPDEVKLVAIVEPDDIRRNMMGDQFGVPMEHRFVHYNDFFANPVPADAVILCTPENEHYKPCMKAIELGYHVLLEKPIAQTLQECLDMADTARRNGVIISVCHVLRYHPFFLKVSELVRSGNLGKVISISHSEGVGLDRATHGYVRGTWNREENGNPMLLAKCCHDVDFLLWITGRRCLKVSSFGSLRWFRSENAPEGAADRCVRCPLDGKCPYSAVDLYWRRRDWISNFDVPEGQTIEDVIRRELNEGVQGRCVYHCDNNVVDHQALMMELEDDIVISMTMDIFTLNDYRTTKICLTEGEIVCDEHTITVTDFRTRRQQVFDFSEMLEQPYHAGADLKIMEEFLRAIRGEETHLNTLIDESIQSHLVCYEAERSRLTGQTITL